MAQGCPEVGREIFQKHSARYWFGRTLQDSVFSFGIKRSAQGVDSTDTNLASSLASSRADRSDVLPSAHGKAAGPSPPVKARASRARLSRP
jgi:hypothetical protein